MSRLALPKLHIVTDGAILRRADFLTVAVELLVTLQRHIALHLRGPGVAATELFHLANSLAAKSAYVGTRLLVNDRCDIALAFDDVGAHVGAAGLPLPEVRRLLPRPRLVGYSAHTAAEAAGAEAGGADFIFAGTIFETLSHPGRSPGGVALLSAITDACSVPVIAIGGVTAERVPEVLSTGAYGVAVIRAIWDARDPVHAAEQFAKMLT